MQDRQERELLDTGEAGRGFGAEFCPCPRGPQFVRRSSFYPSALSTGHWLIFAGGVILGMLLSSA